jgi:DNA-binding PadR family transcriptional regulator
LTSVANGPKHGYAIMADIAGFSGAAWSRAPCTGAVPAGTPRLGPAAGHRPYEITAAGQEILAEQVTTMQQIVRVTRLRTAMAWGA